MNPSAIGMQLIEGVSLLTKNCESMQKIISEYHKKYGDLPGIFEADPRAALAAQMSQAESEPKAVKPKKA